MKESEQLSRANNGTLEYIHAMLGQLSTMAHAERYDLIAHFIEMAYIQAGDTVRGVQPERLDDSADFSDDRNSVA